MVVIFSSKDLIIGRISEGGSRAYGRLDEVYVSLRTVFATFRNVEVIYEKEMSDSYK